MSMTATYSPEDNKLRLYSLTRLSAETYARVKAHGFKWAPKQELFVAPAWTPAREDLLLELCDEIGDEDYSTAERAADRAERFTGYRDKRAEEAGASADTFDNGPRAFGHQSQARAERQAERHDRHRRVACSQWSKAEYWQSRTAGVISNALHRSSAAVRRGRILTLEAEQRKHEASREDYAKRYALWQKVLTLEGLDTPIVQNNERSQTDSFYGISKDVPPAGKLAYALANNGGSFSFDYIHPRTGKATSLYSHLTDSADPITPREAANLWLDGKREPGDTESHSARWSDHYANRLAYERAMLAEEGGTAAEADMVPGGWVKGIRSYGVFAHLDRAEWHQIVAVNRSPVTKRITSVKVMGLVGCNDTKPGLVSCNVERLPEGAYRAPTAEELAAFQAMQAERKAEKKATTPKAPPLINPTDEDAERLQSLWNSRAKERHDKARAKHEVFTDFQPVAVLRMTQARYSEVSKGSYAACETRTLHADGRPARRSSNMYTSDGHAYDKSLPAAVCKLRLRYDAVIVLTDKPQKPLPLDWQAIAAGTVATTTAQLCGVD